MLTRTVANMLRLFGCTVLLVSATVVKPQNDNLLPAPTGEFPVGVVWRHWIDESRDEAFFGAPESKRELVIQILYPASEPESAEPAEYIPHRDVVLPAFNAAIVGAGIVPGLDVPDLSTYQAYAFPDAPLSDEETAYPVLIFSHGGAAVPGMYTAQLEELASHGYVVVGINHTYGTAGAIFPDGRTIPPDFSQGLDPHIPIWSQDQQFVMDQLEAINADDPEGMFTDRLDLNRLGVFGHSMGAQTTTMTCLADSRCKAGVNEDGGKYVNVLEQGLDQPFLFLLSDSRLSAHPASFEKSRGPVYSISMQGFEHLDFGDFTLWSDMEPYREVKWLGSIEAERAVELTRHVLVAFFDRYVKGTDAELVEKPEYPELRITIQDGESS
jgi:pimeloyl-ACP methyl ester carboxylesterase